MRADEILMSLKEHDALDATEFPADQNHGMVLLLDSNKLLQRLVACWSNVTLPLDEDPREQAPEGLTQAHFLRWLWSRIEPDPIPGWLALAGLPDAPHTRRWCMVAMDNRIVFPDGTRSKWATQFVTRQVGNILA